MAVLCFACSAQEPTLNENVTQEAADLIESIIEESVRAEPNETEQQGNDSIETSVDEVKRPASAIYRPELVDI